MRERRYIREILGEGKIWILLAALFLCIGFNAGCDDDDDIAAVAQRAKRDKAKKKKVETQVQEDKSTIGYVYDADNKRDPFKTYFDELMMQEKEQRNLSELQRFDLATLKLVGVVAGTATPMALIEDPSGKGHTIKIGSLVGKNYGQVKQIRRGEIDVQEEFRDFTGKRIRSLKTIKLMPEDENE